MKTAIFSAAAVLTVFAATASAHHSFAMFDQSKEMTLDGTLKELQWTNPHIWVQVMAKDPATGKEVEWSIEGGSPNNRTGTGTLTGAVSGGRVYINGSQVNAVTATDPRAATTDTFFDATNYVGAVRDSGTNWTIGWTVWLNN